MIFALVPIRCIPPDFINPFPPFYMTTAVCSALLLLQTLVLFLTYKGASADLPRHWQNWAGRSVLLISAGAMLGAVGLTVWIWLQSRSFIAWCVPLLSRLSAQDAASHVAQGGVLITVIVTALLLLAGLAMILLIRWQRRSPSSAA